MSNETVSKTICPYCAGHVEFPWDGFGKEIPCSHCARTIELAPGVAIGKQAAPVTPPAIIKVLNAVAVVQFGFAFIVAALSLEHILTSISAVLMIAVSGVFTLALVKLIECSHATAERMAWIEVQMQSISRPESRQ